VAVEGRGGCSIQCDSRRWWWRGWEAAASHVARGGGDGWHPRRRWRGGEATASHAARGGDIPCSSRRRQHPMQLEEVAVELNRKELTLGARAPSRHRTNMRLRPVRCGGSRRRRRPGPQRRRRRHNVSKVEGTRRKEISLWLKYNVTYFTVHDAKKIIDPLFDWR
jgi:hypothetical protein